MAQLLGNVAVGTIVKLKENGSPQNYLVVHQGRPSSMYDASCNGTWLLRQDIIRTFYWNANGTNSFPSSIDLNYLSATVIYLYDSAIQSVIKTVKIPYGVGGGSSQVNSGAKGYSCKLFLLGGYEVGYTTLYESGLPVDGAKLSYFKLGSAGDSLRSANSPWWLRSPYLPTNDSALCVEESGPLKITFAQLTEGVRPAMVMPTDLIVDDNGNITANQLVPPSNITVPSITMQQQVLPISWTPVSVSGADVTYQLQRNVDNGGWTTIYTGADTSYTDTVSTWTQVSYRVATVVLGSTSDYTQSTIIPVSDPSTLVISGSDGNLGTLTSNVPYTVFSNTGNPISLTRTVNGAQVVTLTVDSGFAYSIPVADLPTGTGTIQITASVENSGEVVTATRTWTYYKTPIDIPSTGGIAQLTQNGQNIWPVTVPDAVEAPVYLGGNLNAALNKLGQAALYTKIGSPKYNQVTVDLSKVKVGDEVLLPYNDVMVSHIVVQIGNPDPSMYDSSCDGVWLLRKDIVELKRWNAASNALLNSDIISNMQSYINYYNMDVQNAINTVKIPYCIDGASGTINKLSDGLSCKMFPLSGIEIGGDISNLPYLPVDGTKLDYFDLTNQGSSKRISNYNSISNNWWLRSPFVDGTSTGSNAKCFHISTTGFVGNDSIIKTYGYRPCFIMPTTFNQTYYIDSSNNIHPSQEYTQGGSITDVFGYDVPITQTEIGTYVGTGAAGQSRPNTLTFSFEPKVVFISTKINSTNNTGIFIYDTNAIYFPTSYPTGGSYLGTTWQGNQISWYYANSTAQLNVFGRTYNYIAIG